MSQTPDFDREGEGRFSIRYRDDMRGFGRVAAQRDRDVIVDDLRSHEEPEEISVRRRPVRRTRAFTPQPIKGYEFIDRARSAMMPRRIPADISMIWDMVEFDLDYENRVPDGFMYLDENAVIRVQPHKSALLHEWSFYALHLMYHLALGFLEPPEYYPEPELWKLAAEMLVNQQIAGLPMVTVLRDFPVAPRPSRFGSLFRRLNQNDKVPQTPDQLVESWLENNNPPRFLNWLTPAGAYAPDIMGTRVESIRTYRSMYILDQIKRLKPVDNIRRKYVDSMILRAYDWVQDHFPLLSAAAATFELDFEHAEQYNIAIAAVSARDQIIFVNPQVDLNELEWQWVLVHEILHVVLEHQQRLGQREPLIWNVACDYVINNWLEQMGVGMRPQNVLFKEEYKGTDAETIYDSLIKNGGNDQLKIVTFRGDGMGDMLDFDSKYNGTRPPRFRNRFRTGPRQMAQNAARDMLEDESNGQSRGHLPGELIDELDLGKMLRDRVEIPEWKAELAEWFNIQFTPRPPRRSYARLSRRQSAVPHIPLAGKAPIDYHSPTFGVLLDTSGSMSPELLQSGLAAMIAFAEQHGVAFVRFVMCDARPFDEGFIPIEKLRRPYRIRGRGGTVLQPAVELLQEAQDFPKEAPILIITDGDTDHLHVQREHAYLLPGNGDLPFEPDGPVFRILPVQDRRGGFRRRLTNNGDNAGNNADNGHIGGSFFRRDDSHPPVKQKVNELIERIKNI